MKNTETQAKVLGNSIGLIIAILAILNYLNMMASSIQNRSVELATLESIGMTIKQIKKMLGIEGIGYAAISILASLAVGLPLSYLVFENTNLYRIPYSIPWARNLTFFGAIFILCIAAPVLIYQRTQSASIIERMKRSDT